MSRNPVTLPKVAEVEAQIEALHRGFLKVLDDHSPHPMLALNALTTTMADIMVRFAAPEAIPELKARAASNLDTLVEIMSAAGTMAQNGDSHEQVS